MSEPARKQQVVSVVTYLHETIAEIDQAIADLQKRRGGLAVRLAALEASDDQALRAAAAEHARRVETGQDYEDDEDAEQAISTAYRRFGP